MTSDARWYVIWCQTGAERETLARVSSVPGVDQAMAPMQALPYRQGGAWVMREAVVIPSYVFARCKMDSSIYHAIKDTPKVLGWLGKDGYWPEIVPEAQMEPVLALDRGEPPESVLTGVKIDRHKRRGHGAITLNGQTRTVTFCPTEYKQAEETRVDKRPADAVARTGGGEETADQTGG